MVIELSFLGPFEPTVSSKAGAQLGFLYYPELQASNGHLSRHPKQADAEVLESGFGALALKG